MWAKRLALLGVEAAKAELLALFRAVAALNPDTGWKPCPEISDGYEFLMSRLSDLPLFWLVANFCLVDPRGIRGLLQYFYNLFQVAFRYGQIAPETSLRTYGAR